MNNSETKHDAAKALELKNKGNQFVKEKEYAKASELYTQAIAFDPENAILYSNRAFTNLKLDNFQNSLNDSQRAIELDSNNLKAYHRRAMSHIGLLEFKKARKDLLIVLKFKPNELTAKNALTICDKVIQKEKFEKAISGGESSIVDLCQTLNLSSFDANADLISYTGKTLEFEQLTNEQGSAAGVRVKNMTQDFITYMIKDVFLAGKYLPKAYVAAIISHADSLFKSEPTVVELNNEKDVHSNISICGDTHGQFYDVLNIFKTYGKVDESHIYVFNGDFVDRGSWSCEVAILFYSLKLLYPKNIYLNRGNHETSSMNKVYGFEDECKYKYSQRVFDLFSQSFESLPLAVLINDAYLVMHGGLPSDTSATLEDMKKIDRFKQPPREGIFMEMLWADPQVSNGFGPSPRGLSSAFGPDITQQFLENNNLKRIIRSHEVRHGGYDFEHNGNLITLFSAPNYCDTEKNLGAIIHVSPGNKSSKQSAIDKDLIIETFTASPHPDIKPMAYSNGGLGF